MQSNVMLEKGQPRSKWNQATQKKIRGDYKLCHLVALNLVMIKTTFNHHSFPTTKMLLANDQKNISSRILFIFEY